MAFFSLCIVIFIMFFQPTSVFPSLEEYQPLRYSAFIALLAYILSGKKADSSFLSLSTNRLFLLFIGMQALSASSIWLTGGIDRLNTWKSLAIMYFLIVKSCLEVKHIKYISVMIILAIVYLSYFSISTFVSQYTIGLRAGGFGWYENANDLCMILVSVVPLCFLLAESVASLLIRYIFVFIAAVFGFNILFTGSRNGLLGLLTAGGLSLVLSKKLNGFVRTGILVLMVFSVLTVGLAVVMGRDDLAGLSGDESSENRLVQWRACLSMIKTHPFLGVGPGEAPSEMENYGGVRGLAVHNTLIQVFAETGLPGGVFYFLFACYPLLEGSVFFFKFRNFQHDIAFSQYKYLLIALFSFWICAIFGNRVEAYILYILVGLIVAARENINRAHTPMTTSLVSGNST